MKTLLQFLLRYSIFFMFVAMEVLAFVLMTHKNAYQRNAVLASCNRVTASMYAAETAVVGYFGLREENERLAEENVELRNKINELENVIECGVAYGEEYVSVEHDVEYVGAQVVNLSVNQARNYLTINKGERDGVGTDMGVRCKEGVVGIVSAVSDRFAVVIPLLNPDISISCRLKKNDYIGSLQWEGRDPRYAGLKDVARHIEIAVGDTIVTSGLSAIFPKDIPVGVVEEDRLEEGDVYHTIKVRLFADFRRLGKVSVIKNNCAREQVELELESERQ